MVWHHPEVSSSAIQTGPAVDIALITYNIWGLPAWLNGASSSRYSRIARELRHQDPDIIFLQEVWFGRSYQALPAGGTWSIASGPRRPWFARPSGLVALSRFPIIDGEFHPFRARSWPDSLAQKGALKVTIDLGHQRRLNVWNVHLQAGAKHEIRTRQIAELAEWIREANDDQIADVIAGDFNCTPDSLQYQQLTALLGPDANAITPQQRFITYDGLSRNPAEGRTLDYVFILPRESVQSVRADPKVVFAADRLEDRLSDHLGIHVTLNLELMGSANPSSALASLGSSPVRALLPLHEPVGD